MDEKPVVLPLAFMLALGVSNSAVGLPTDPRALLSPGSLSGYAEQGAAYLGSKSASSPLSQGHLNLAQWFNSNWFSCFQGFWRRC